MSRVDAVDPAIVEASQRAAAASSSPDLKELIDAPAAEIRAAYAASSAVQDAADHLRKHCGT